MTPDQAYDAGRVGYRLGMRETALQDIPPEVHEYWIDGWEDEREGCPVPPHSVLDLA